MPTYEYVCNGGHEFEVVQSIQEGPIERCPKCRRICKRLISESSFILKGKGWAKDGYGNGTKRKNKRPPKGS
jgi:putative FmdB family regulatory protein